MTVLMAMVRGERGGERTQTTHYTFQLGLLILFYCKKNIGPVREKKQFRHSVYASHQPLPRVLYVINSCM